MKTLYLSVVGAGGWSTAMHLPVLKKLAASHKIVFTGVCDFDGQKARAYADELGTASVHADMAEMLSSVRADGVILLVPPAANPGVIRAAIRARKPFLVEKPPATDAATHRALARAAGRLTHLVAYNRRHSPYTLQARSWMRNTRIQAVVGQFSRYRRRESDFTSTAVHGIDTVRFLAGSDLARYEIETAHTGHAWNFFIHGWFKNGARCDLQVTPDTGSSEEHYTIRSADRTVSLSFPHRAVHDLPGFVELRERNAVTRHLGPSDFGVDPKDIPTLAGILGEHLAFIRALRTGKPAASTLSATLQTQEIREALEKSQRRNRA